ncbi:MAG TPA: hypothetical protein PLG34_10180 [Spirochaetota bacterium]|nr:MAG: hypothetical protein BWX91_02200 [Spirochaetes bacterium ADurb.Bin133]HNZ27965.1 hypothetical protein [Spirochaetota bacterium]HPY88338.1 hypothetical protein [Spirochaetota bacterium]HQB60237.1 hypothetical protein [Spirochaetota bacterium]
MGISRLKRLLTEALSQAFTVDRLQLFGREIIKNLDLHELTGFPPNCSIPRKDAANELVEYLFEINKTIQLIHLIINTSQNGFKSEKYEFQNLKLIINEMKECGYEYNQNLNKIVKIEKNEKRNDWGFLEDGKSYNFCFVSVDICGNSKLVRKYDGAKIKESYKIFKSLVVKAVESRNGRIWSWEGDGGLLVFHLDDFVDSAVLASIDIMTSLIVFNSTMNLLGEDIIIRMGINVGGAEYKKEVDSIISDSIELAKKIEKNHTTPQTVSISKNSYQHVNSALRNYFREKEINGMTIYQLSFPIKEEVCK